MANLGFPASSIADKNNFYTKTESDAKYLTEHQTLKTINGNSIVGSGNITIEGGSGASTDEIVTAVIAALPIYNGEVESA